MVSVKDRVTGPDRGGPGGLGGTRESAGQRDSANVIRSLIACPECGLPAEITDRFALGGTDGPVEHVCVACVDGHYFRMPADMLTPPTQLLASDRHADPGCALSAGRSGAGFSRLPGTLGTVRNADSGSQHF